jgi:prepilin-type N-terminal cleavage/methylation domain-containing protein
MKQLGFTLIELLVVIGILGALTGILFAQVNKSREKARFTGILLHAETLHRRLGANCFAEWNFDTIITATAADSCGTFDGTIYGAETAEGIKNSSSLQFDGIDDYIDLGVIDIKADGAGENGFTIASWFKADAWTNGIYRDGRIITKSINHYNDGIYWMLSTIAVGGETRLRFRLKTNGTTDVLIADSGDITLNKWHFATATYDGSSMKLYLDGEQVGTMAKTGPVDTNSGVSAYIGNSSDIQRPWSGFIDEVRIYAEVVTTSQIHKWYTEKFSDGELVYNF